MARFITKQQILDLVKDQHFETEDNFRDYLAPKLAELFKVNKEQVETEPVTTSFDGTLSNRADIIIRNEDGNFKKALIVFELKLSKSVDKFNNGDYTGTDKQLKKYCQDVRAPYGVLLTENFCAIYRNKYFSYDQEPKRGLKNIIPTIEGIENIMAKEALVDFFFLNKSLKYIYYLIFVLIIYFLFAVSLEKAFGLWISMLISFLISIIGGGVIAIIFKVR